MVNSRNKGHGFERWVADKLKEIFPKARRKLEYHKDDCTGVDLLNTEPYLIQCKAYKTYAPINKIEEIQGEGVRLLITKGDRKKPVVCLYLDDFINILGES